MYFYVTLFSIKQFTSIFDLIKCCCFFKINSPVIILYYRAVD